MRDDLNCGVEGAYLYVGQLAALFAEAATISALLMDPEERNEILARGVTDAANEFCPTP